MQPTSCMLSIPVLPGEPWQLPTQVLINPDFAFSVLNQCLLRRTTMFSHHMAVRRTCAILRVQFHMKASCEVLLLLMKVALVCLHFMFGSHIGEQSKHYKCTIYKQCHLCQNKPPLLYTTIPEKCSPFGEICNIHFQITIRHRNSRSQMNQMDGNSSRLVNCFVMPVVSATTDKSYCPQNVMKSFLPRCCCSACEGCMCKFEEVTQAAGKYSAKTGFKPVQQQQPLTWGHITNKNKYSVDYN